MAHFSLGEIAGHFVGFSAPQVLSKFLRLGLKNVCAAGDDGPPLNLAANGSQRAADFGLEIYENDRIEN